VRAGDDPGHAGARGRTPLTPEPGRASRRDHSPGAIGPLRTIRSGADTPVAIVTGIARATSVAHEARSRLLAKSCAEATLLGWNHHDHQLPSQLWWHVRPRGGMPGHLSGGAPARAVGHAVEGSPKAAQITHPDGGHDGGRRHMALPPRIGIFGLPPQRRIPVALRPLSHRGRDGQPARRRALGRPPWDGFLPAHRSASRRHRSPPRSAPCGARRQTPAAAVNLAPTPGWNRRQSGPPSPAGPPTAAWK
jgi:hypothetical protein